MRLMTKTLVFIAVVGLTAMPVLAAPMMAPAGVHAAAPSSAPVSSPVKGLLGFLTAGSVFGITIKKDIGSIAQKFVTRAQAAQGDYKTGVAAAGSTWEQSTGASEAAYEAGVQQSITNKRFAKGVQGKGGKYQTNAVNLGSQRYGPGVANAQQAYQAGMAPVLAALSSIQLPAPSFRGSPANQARANVVATTLSALRTNK